MAISKPRRYGSRTSTRNRLKRAGMAIFFDGEQLFGRTKVRKAAMIDARKILEGMGALDRVRFVNWIMHCDDPYELEMPPPVIAEIVGRARERLGIK